MRRYACMALTNLTFGDGTNKALLCSMKPSMDSLVAQLFSSNEELCQVAASVLRNLSWKADLASKKTLREVGAVTSLMKAAMRVQKETTLKSILSALWNLSAHCSENKADICAVKGALEFLIGTLTFKSPSKTSAIIENGGGILRNVSSHIAVREDYRQILREHGCMQILLKHLRATSLTIVSNACGTLWNLSARCAEDQQALWEMGAVGMLRNLVHSKHKMISMGSSAALKNLLAARPAMKNIELNKHSSQNRPSLHVRKQRALESELDQNLSETCENVESPRDSPVEGKKQDSSHFVYPVFQDGDPRRPLVRAPVMPRSQSGDNALYANTRTGQGVARSGSQDSVGSTHSDISHDRARHVSGGNQAPRSMMGGSLDRHRDESLGNQRGQTERNPLGSPNSRILKVMQEVAMHAGIDSKSHGNDTTVFKVPFPVQNIKPKPQQQPSSSSNTAISSQNHINSSLASSSSIPSSSHHPYQGLINHMQNQSASYQRYHLTTAPAHGNQNNFASLATGQRYHCDDDSDEQPLDYSMKYKEGGSLVSHHPQGPRLPHPQPVPRHGAQFIGNHGNAGFRGRFPGNMAMNMARPPFMYQQDPNMAINPRMPRPGNKRFQFNNAYAETDLDEMSEQPTDYSARYGVEYNHSERGNFRSQYDETDPDCADCKYEEARRFNDHLDQANEDDQIRTFCTEDTPHLSTATSLTDLSTAMKILEEAEENCPEDDRDLEGDETQNYGSKYGETDSKGQGHQRLPESGQGQRSDDEMKGQRFDGEKSSWSGSNVTDMRTATTVISNYHLKADRRSQESVGNHCEEPPERSFHANRSEDAPLDQTKTYCEEGTPVCFSRVSSLSSLHSSEANDRAERVPNGPLTRIDESDDVGKLPSQSMSMHTYRQTKDGHHMGDTSSEKEHKTVTFDDKEQVQETPMMFSRCTSLGSLSSFDTQSVHSSVFSEYSRRASEVVSPSELPDSPSETMPPSPKRTKSPERNARSRVQQELFPPVSLSNEQFRAIGSSNALRNFFSAAVMGGQIKPIDYETGSCKSEAPVVYADEGTPPIFNDNLSELSCITSDAYNINDKTLVGSQGGNMTPGAKSHSSGGTAGSQGRSVGSAILMKENTNTRGREDSKLAAKNENDHQKSESETKHALGTVSQQSEHKQTACESNEAAERWETSDKGSSECKDMVSVSETSVAASRVEEKAESSNSEVSEGEDDILANFISSAMPTSTKKSRRSSESASRRRSSSSKPDSGSSSRLKTPNSSQPQSGSSSKSASVNSSAKKSKPSNNNTSTSSKENSPENKSSSKENMASQEPRSSPGKSKSQIPRPLQHRQLQQLTAEAHVSHLDTSLDSNLEDESPFNVSNTQSVMARSAQKTRPLDSNMTQKQQHQPNRPTAQPSPLILQKARHLSNMDYGDDDDTGGCKTYATEDTPFSRSIQASPKAGRKLNAAIMYPDVGADTVRSFATEDTPFSGSMPGSPPPEGQQGSYGNDVDIEPDTIKCYNTEDTPFSGSALGSPKLERKIQALPNNKPAVSQPQPQIDTKNVPSTSAQSQHRFHFGPPLSSTSQEQNKVPARNDIYDNRMVNNFGYQFDDVDDVKTFAVEGTPLDYSRTGSCSDLSCLNSNFDDKLYLNPAVSTSKGAVTGNGNAPFTNVKTSNSNQNSATPASNLSSGKFQQGANQSESSSNKATVANNQTVFHSNAVVDDQSDSSSLDENDDLLSEVIMSAMPAPKAVGKSRRSIDRKPEGAETSEMDKIRVSNISNPSLMSRKPNISSYPANFQPQRTSSLAQDGVSNCISVKNGIGVRNGNSNFQHVVSDPAEYLDQVKTYAVEDTPSVSNNTSLSNLTNHSGMNKSAKKFSPRSQPSASAQSLSNNSVLGSSYSQPVSYGMGNDLVFFQNEGVGDSMRVWKTEDTPKSFSCNDSLSSLGIVDDDSNNIVAQQMKALVDKMTSNTGNQSANNQSIGGKGALHGIEQGLESGVLKRSEFIESDLDKQRSASRTSVFSNISQNSGNELVRHVIGQSSEEQSIHEEDHKSSANSKEPVEEVKSYTVEDTPICFSRSSSLSSINDKDGDKQPAKIPEPDKRTTVSNKQASKDEKAGYQVEHTPICFSRNSSLSSLSVHSDDDDDDDPDDLALLEDCISSAMPQKTRQSRDRRPDSRGSNASNSSASVAKSQRHTEPRYEQSIAHGGHDSRLSSWQAQPLKPSDEMFRKPTMDAKGRPCRRSRSQDNEKYLKDLSNQQLVQQYGRNSIHRSSIDSIPVNQLPINQNAPAIVSKQIISETKNFTHQMMQMTRSADKGDNRDSDAVSSPASDYNFFMTCSGNTEISVEGISKESFPSYMAPDTDDDFLDGSLISSYKQDGHHSGPGSSHESTLIERNGSLSLNSTLTDGHHNNRRSAGNKNNHRHGMEVSLTSEDERALAENAKIVVSAMKIQQQMIVSGASTVDDDRFVENETLSLVSNDYASDTASEASDLPSENSSGRGDGRSQSGGRPRIVKPGDIGSQITPKQMEDEVKGVRGKRKPLYHNKAANSPMGDKIRSPGVGKMSPRSVPGSAATNNHNLSNQHQSSNTSRSFNTSGAPVNTSGRSANNSSHGSNMSGGRSGNSSRESRKGHTLRTIPQASSTPVKSGSPASPAYRSQSGSSGAKTSPHQRSSSLDQRSSSLEQRSQLKDVKNSSGRSESVNRSSGANRSASASRNGSGLANMSDQSKGKSNGKTKNELQDIQIKGRGLSKQGTFVKESTNKNAPVISPGDKSRDITDNVGVKMRQKKQSESSQTNRHSSGSSKSNFSNTSNNSNSFSTTSSDSPPDSWSKTLNSYNLRTEPEVAKKGQTPFGSSVRRNILNDGQASKIPSPSRSGGKKSTAAVSGKSPGQIVVKSRSGSSLGKAEIKHAGSSNSLKLPGSRPTTPVVMGNAVLQGTRKGSDSSLGNKEEKKGTSKKGVTGKIAGLWRSESKKNKTDKKNASKLPVSKGNKKSKKALLEDVNTVQEKQDSSSKQNANRNTYILTESSVDGISKSSTYDKLSSTNDISQVPNHDSVTGSRSGTLERSRATGSTARPVLETDNDLNKTCREVTAFEVGVEYDLEEAWASNIEKSIASMSRSIEQNKNSSGVADRSTTFYDDFVDTSRMDLTNSPANRLSKSGSMSEIELEFGRIHSGTWTKKRSQNDVALLPNADETSRTMPLVKRSESLNLTAHLGVSHLEYDDDGQEVWIRRDDRLRASDITMGKKKKVFKGSSGFLNVVSKMFGGGSKKGAEKQSKSFHVSEKDLKKMNESNAKASKKEKLNKSEVKPGKSEAKALKAEQKAEAKMTKSLQKALKKEAKLSKSGKGKKSVDVDDVSSSTSSLKKSSEDLIEIDRDDDDVDDDVFAKQKSNGTLNRTAFTLSTNSSASVSDSVQTSPKTPEMKKSLSVITNQSDVKISNNNTSPGSTSFISNSSSGSGSPNCSQKSSPCFAHMTKTEMLIARRQRQISQESEHDDNVDKKKCVITTV
ncbi:hypothetical protein DPMN_181175 [Dreissena polymorpha]|uniref:Adenomatous polyposis coli protein n=2 Tax=Dreissena polymorpha TaxID=45954 RepID=A0A9D4DCB4_DREPO|nr:hypothetical protein DPMN_181175 [Dreissena polymorpha]